MTNDVKDKKRDGAFMKAAIVITALYVLGVVAAVIVFQAQRNPIEPMTVAALIGVGMGEFGCCGLIKTASEKRAAAQAEAESAAAEIEAANMHAEAAWSRMGNAEDIAKQALAETKKMKAERDAARKEAAALKRRLKPLEEIIRQNAKEETA